MDNLKRQLAWLIVAGLVLLYSVGLLALYNRHPDSASDFRIYYRGATRVIEGKPLYQNLVTGDYLGPSLVVQVLAPVVALTDYRTSANIWFITSLILSFITTAMIAESLSTRRDRIALWILSLLLLPTFLALWMGQVSVILFFLLVFAWRSYRRGQPVLCGILLGIAIWTKFFPALLVVYFAWKQQWRVVIAAVGGALATILFQVIVSGLPSFIDYYTTVLPTLAAEGQPELAAANHSVLGFVQKTFLTVRNGIPLVDNETLMQLTRIGLSGLLLAVLFYLTWRWKQSEPIPVEQFDLEYAMALTVALLLGSTMGYYGAQAALLPFAVIWNYSHQRVLVSMWFFLTIMLLNFYLLLLLAHLRLGSETRMSWILLSTPFFGMMILWGWLVLLLRGKRWTS